MTKSLSCDALEKISFLPNYLHSASYELLVTQFQILPKRRNVLHCKIRPRYKPLLRSLSFLGRSTLIPYRSYSYYRSAIVALQLARSTVDSFVHNCTWGSMHSRNSQILEHLILYHLSSLLH